MHFQCSCPFSLSFLRIYLKEFAFAHIMIEWIILIRSPWTPPRSCRIPTLTDPTPNQLYLLQDIIFFPRLVSTYPTPVGECPVLVPGLFLYFPPHVTNYGLRLWILNRGCLCLRVFQHLAGSISLQSPLSGLTRFLMYLYSQTHPLCLIHILLFLYSKFWSHLIYSPSLRAHIFTPHSKTHSHTV